MSTPITNTVSTFIDSQIPEFIRENDPNFSAFIKAYYQWMETSNDSAVIAQTKSLLSYKDIDQTTDQFIQYFINDFLPYFPNDTVLDQRKLIKAARNFYQKKGSVESVQFLFRVLYGQEANIYFPKDQVLKTSDGKWTIPKSLRLVLSDGYVNFDVNQLVGRQGLGSVSNASCIIESATKTVDQGLGIELLELYISDVNQTFSDLENLNVVYGFDSNNDPLIFSEKIIASLSDIKINPQARGLLYKGYAVNSLGQITYPGDPVVISGGLANNDLSAQKAVAYVGNVTSGSITGVTVNYGGAGYRVFPNTEVTVVNDPTDNTGAGANIIVTGIDTGNLITLNVNIDSIEFQAGNVMNGTFGFANFASTNANTFLAQAFSFEQIQFGAITSMEVVNGGGAYIAAPSLNLEVVYYTDLVYDTPSGNTTLLQNIDDLGYVCNVIINNGGTGYSNTTDTIIVPSSIGYNAAFDFVTDVSGRITSVIINNRGEGYIYLPYNLKIVNSANHMNSSAGSNASLTAYGFGQGANLSLTVSQIGQITDFRITNRGFDYVAAPNISLRVADIVIDAIPPGNVFVVDSQIYQGSSLLNATWKAYVDSYNTSSGVLRTYNYQGALNPNLPLVATTIPTVTINTAVTKPITLYGNGLAKANAIFLNGLIQYPGFYLGTDGQLSADKYLQDSNTYHNYSYVIVVEKALKEYKKTLLQLVHPVGMSMLGNYSAVENVEQAIESSANVLYNPVVAGSITIDNFNVPLFADYSTDLSTPHAWLTGGNASTTTDVVYPTDLTSINIPSTSLAYVNTGVEMFSGSNLNFNVNMGPPSSYLSVKFAANSTGSGPYLILEPVGYNANSGLYISASYGGGSWYDQPGVPYLTGQPLTSNTWYSITIQMNSDLSGNLYVNGVATQSFNLHQVGISSVGAGNSWVGFYGGGTPGNYYSYISDVTVTKPSVGNDNAIVGTGTDFGNESNVGDIIIFPTNDTSRRLQAKSITSITNGDYINIESNTEFFFYSNVSVTANTNIINGPYLAGNVGIGDVVSVNTNTPIFLYVSNVSQNTITVNTVFSSNHSNLLMLVFPQITNASYSIVTT